MFYKYILFIPSLLLLFGCENKSATTEIEFSNSKTISKTSLVVLGVAQDAGYPQIGCTKSCCINTWNNFTPTLVTSLGIVDKTTQKTYLFEATPDIKFQIKELSSYLKSDKIVMPNGIFLTHAHMGHYTGLMQLGREAINSNNIPVYAMPRMYEYLNSSGPWNQLIDLKNINLKPINDGIEVTLSSTLKVTPFIVPHRGEYTETVGYRISGPNKTALFIPDIDKWNKWKTPIEEEIKKVDYAFIDATFYKNGEIGNRDMSEIPHPFVEESLKRFKNLTSKDKSKVHFIHFNHTNQLLQPNSEAQKQVKILGYNIAQQGQIFDL
ncbi:pyrroloquinoline quinone biosynthesis protein PqqB [Winogradskyella sp. PC-19]|uniref:MBL fold metallo-hydrolase n=1 Tax=unclassified Winogradskyella TaxID=2615021 RepID=UPI000B3C6D8D|nr:MULTISPECIES: MBL fold metallo-hydrolase [unclassified Winogradskyella]ARV08994.1 pyrroloquinoline quinone biosynthesis protein PqqB [Winogradskyella sp. PC-19]